MNYVNPRDARRRAGALASLLALAAPVIAGCGADRPADYQRVRRDSGYPTDVTTPPTVAKGFDAAPGVKSSNPLTNEQDPLVLAAGDPLARGSDHTGQNDPLMTVDSAPAAPPPADDDPLARQNVYSGTEHSHWLRGSVSDANVEIALNGARLMNVFSNTDRDITRNCRKGLNTVTFTYIPRGSTSSALLNVLESEHNPPIPPLATFNSQDQSAAPPAVVGVSAAPNTITRTFTFMAH